jgi:hypothetical protein
MGRARTEVWLLGACVVALLACKSGPSGFGRGFVSGCDSGCQRSGGDATCKDWCQCTYDQVVEEQGSVKEADDWLIENTKSGTWSPELARTGGEAISRCAPGLYEKKARHACTEECKGESACDALCACLLDELLKLKPTKEESIVFLAMNVDMNETPEGTAAVNQAVKACQSK